MAAGEFVPGSGGKDCEEKSGGWGIKSTSYDWIWKGDIDRNEYPEDACPPRYHGTAQIDSLQINTELNGLGDVNVQGTVQGSVVRDSGGNILSNKKNLPFDMPHPNKKGWRLRHVCIEGPEIAVYCRGKIPADGVINLPSFWDGLVNKEDMSISLTPIGTWQELFVKEIKWGKQIVVRNNAGGPINGDYYIVARRLDDDLIVEYEGESHEDYPGGNAGYSFNFEDGYMKDLIKKFVNETLDKGN